MLGRKSGLLVFMLVVGSLLTVMLMPSALADRDYSVLQNNTYVRANSNVIVHLWVNVTDKPMGNVYPSSSPESTQWAHLVFTYENTGDTSERAYVDMEFIDSNGNVYTPPDMSISDADVPPHSTTSRLFVEIPIPGNVTLSKLHIYQGTNPAFHIKDQYYDLVPIPTPTPVPATATPGSTAATTQTGCLGALLPFALLSSIGVAGVTIKKYGLNK
jgi:hypothetical protein